MNKMERLMKNLPRGIDAALITSEQNRRYYTGFPSTAGILFVTREQAYFLIDSRYIEAAKAAIQDCEVLLLEDAGKSLQSLCGKHRIHTVGTENSYLTLADFKRYQKLLGTVRLSDDPDLDDCILAQRKIKTPDEVELIRAAQKLTDETFAYICGRIEAGRTEREVALDMEFYMRGHGAEAVSFDFIVVSGANSSKPHGVPTDKKIARGDFVTMDFGAIVDGYHSDMTRTVAVGEVSDEQRKVYGTVLEAQLASLAAVAVGKPCKEVDKAARDLIYAAGYEGCFGHGLGHSVGVEIHENPRFSPAEKAMVEPGIVMTVEPGIYLPGRFGVRIEDMVFVTEQGAENLTHSPKELMIL